MNIKIKNFKQFLYTYYTFESLQFTFNIKSKFIF